jgi:hypothetical protein
LRPAKAKTERLIGDEAFDGDALDESLRGHEGNGFTLQESKGSADAGRQDPEALREAMER